MMMLLMYCAQGHAWVFDIDAMPAIQDVSEVPSCLLEKYSVNSINSGTIDGAAGIRPRSSNW
jgi:hypothetical protein